MDVYDEREQTSAKHFILKRYLQELAFKVLNNWDIAYVDGFSGPWKSKCPDFSDTSFMIAISVLKDAQQRIQDMRGIRRQIKCFFSENDPEAFRQLSGAVEKYHDPSDCFEIRAYRGDFVNAVEEIQDFIGSAFPLVFIDPTGWTGYPFAKIAPLFGGPKCEVIINFMYSFVTRFIDHPDERITASLDPILGGPDWKLRLDKALPPGLAVEKLFRQSLAHAGGFNRVVSTRIDKSTEDRPHFFLVYGTKDRRGLKAFREIEHSALREHAKSRSSAKDRKRELRSGTPNLFADFEADQQAASIDRIILEQKELAKVQFLALLATRRSIAFADAVDLLIQAFILRETNVKDICLELAREGKIRNTWGSGQRKPQDGTIIELADD